MSRTWLYEKYAVLAQNHNGVCGCAQNGHDHFAAGIFANAAGNNRCSFRFPRAAIPRRLRAFAARLPQS